MLLWVRVTCVSAKVGGGNLKKKWPLSCPMIQASFDNLGPRVSAFAKKQTKQWIHCISPGPTVFSPVVIECINTQDNIVIILS